MTNNSTPIVGLFDINDYRDMVHVVHQALNLPEEEILRCLSQEILETGSNVARTAKTFGVIPHVYNKQMQEFYEHTNAFVFELLITHLSRFCQIIDGRITGVIRGLFNERRDLQILVLGDGIGTDSLRFAAMGYNVTYFEFKGCSSAVAVYRFLRQGFTSRITVIHKIEELPVRKFDVVICREVLEHVNNPVSVIENIWKYLKNDGIAIITESFNRIDPAFPTHLIDNVKYDGKMEYLFVKAGFRILESFPVKKPMVFQKTKKVDLLRFLSLCHYFILVIKKYTKRHLFRFIRF